MASDYAAFTVQFRDIDGEQFLISSLEIIVPSATGVNTGTDVLTKTAHGFLDTDMVLYTAGAVAIGGLTTGNYYFVRDKTADTFKLATTSGGSAINLTSTGTGDQTFTQAVQVKVRADGAAADLAESPLETDEDGEIVAGTFASPAVGTKVLFRVENWRGRAFSTAQITTV